MTSLLLFKDLMKSLQRNIPLYGVLKIFAKRVFLPLTTIYLVEVGGLSLKQIGLLATISALVSITAEIPTGFFADRLTRRSALMATGFFTAVGTLILVIFPGFHGAIVAVMFEALGYAFLNGAGEALIHDTLTQLKQSDNYPKVVGRAQSFGLIGNAILLATVPLTYRIDKRLPFLCGTLAYVALMVVAWLMLEPKRMTSKKLSSHPLKDLYLNVRIFVFRSSILLFMAIGLLGALTFTNSDFTNLIFKDLGLSPSLLGFVFAGSSIAGIIGGYFIHHLRAITLRQYALIDTAVLAFFMLSIGITRNLYVAIVAVIVYMGWWRLRQILYQYHLLNMYKKTAYKATLISAMWFFIRGNEIWLPFAFVGTISMVGFYTGYIWIGAASTLVLIPMLILSTYILTRHLEKSAS